MPIKIAMLRYSHPDGGYSLHEGDAAEVLAELPPGSVDTTITSPPYFRLKDYGVEEQIGIEKSLDAYLDRMMLVLQRLYTVTAETGCCFVVIGDTYSKGSQLLVPHQLGIRARSTGWLVRNDLIWAKTDAPPERAMKRWRSTHEHVLFLVKNLRLYHFNSDAIRGHYSERTLRRWGKGQAYGGPKATEVSGPKGQRFNRGKSFVLHHLGPVAKDVLEMPTARSRLPHYATFPEALVERLLLASTKQGALVLDPFAGTSTTGAVALRHQRRFIGIDINPRYLELSQSRLAEIV